MIFSRNPGSRKMNYEESLSYLNSLYPSTRPCLERMIAFMKENGSKQDTFKSIQVGGTNGKGSVVAILDSVLRAYGLKVGRFTGPHILAWNERLHLNGEPIDDQTFARLATELKEKSEDFGRRNPEWGPLTWFEFITAMAFFYFAESRVDIAVVEVGLGGRWDATTVLSQPLATAVTNVELDHTQILGKTVVEIAREKGGTTRARTPMITAASNEALRVLMTMCIDANAPIIHCKQPDSISLINPSSIPANHHSSSAGHFYQIIDERKHLSLAGSHQRSNALVACAILLAVDKHLNLSGRPIQSAADGFASVYWPGRMQYLPDSRLVMDGAHNPSGAKALRAALDEHFPDTSITFLAGCFKNKDIDGLVKALVKPGDRLIACQAQTRRSVSPPVLIKESCEKLNVSAQTAASVDEGLKAAFKERKHDEIVVATGSFAIVSEVMRQLGWTSVEDGRPHTQMIWQPEISTV